MKFKIGDKVKYGDNLEYTGTIVGESVKNKGYYCVTIDGGYNSTDFETFTVENWLAKAYDIKDSLKKTLVYRTPVNIDNIKHYRVRYTKLAEKMYPKGKKEGDWWLL